MNYVYKFTDNTVELKDLETSLIYQAVQDADKGNYKKLKSLYDSTYNISNLIKGYYLLRGWYFNIKPFCKCYLVEYTYNEGVYHKYYAPNKTCLYKHIKRHHVSDIIEVVRN